MIKQIIITLLLITNIYANSEKSLCKDLVDTNNEYIKCLVDKTNNNPSIENLNFLAGVYAVNRDYPNALKYYTESENKGDKKAIYYQAGIYNEELKDSSKAIEYFSKVKDYKDSTCQIGKIYYKTSEKKELEFYDDEVKNKNYEAAFCKGKFYLDRKEYKKAEKFYKIGAKYENVNSTYALGSLFTAQKKNVKKAKIWYHKAYKLGDMRSASNIGKFYFDDYKLDQAFKWAKIAADGGMQSGWTGMAQIYKLKGQEKKSIEVLTEYGNRGFPYGYTQAGIYYYQDFKDFENAKKMFLKALALNDPQAANELAYAYHKVKKDYKKAEEWYKKAYSLGARGESLGIMFYKNKQYQKSQEWFEKIYKEQKNSIAASYLGHIHSKIYKDYDKAKEWFLEAYKLGHIASGFSLGYMYRYDLKDDKNAIVWFKKVKDMGDIGLGKAQYQLHKLGVKYDGKK
jgi:TPR repeat protein